MNTFQRLTLTAILAATAVLTAGCSGNSTQADPAPASAAAKSSSPATSATPTTVPVPSATPNQTLPAGIVAKGVANDGKGNYLQTSIADTDPAMKYDPAIADAAAKTHFSEADLADAQKAAVKFIAEEAIDSTLNGGNGNVDAWFSAHKDEILPANQAGMLADMKSGRIILATENWMNSKPGYSYVHGDGTPRVISRTITPTNLRFVSNGALQGVMLDAKIAYGMKVTGGSGSGIQNSTGEVSFAVAKDTDGKWKIAGYNTNYHTAEG